MTPTQIAAVTLLACAVIYCLYLIGKRAVLATLDALSESASLDSEPSRMARASTEREPTDAEALFCVAFLVFAIACLGLLWCGFADAMVCWMAGHVAAMRPH